MDVKPPIELWKEQLTQRILTPERYRLLINLSEYKSKDPDKLREYFEKEEERNEE